LIDTLNFSTFFPYRPSCFGPLFVACGHFAIKSCFLFGKYETTNTTPSPNACDRLVGNQKNQIMTNQIIECFAPGLKKNLAVCLFLSKNVRNNISFLFVSDRKLFIDYIEFFLAQNQGF